MIEAGCSFNSTQIVGAPGTYAVVSCPAGCAHTGGLWGTDLYTGDSICKAGVHAGVISDAGGAVGVLLDVGHPRIAAPFATACGRTTTRRIT